MDLSSKIEAALFVAGEPVAFNKLAKICGAKTGEIGEALAALKEKLQNRGLRLIETSDGVELVTVGEAAPFIEELLKEDFKKELTPASLETLAIIVYEGPISRARIDSIRGVDSRFILRNLAIRGLVERIEDANDLRIPKYDLTAELLKYMGAGNREELKNLIQGNTKESDNE